MDQCLGICHTSSSALHTNLKVEKGTHKSNAPTYQDSNGPTNYNFHCVIARLIHKHRFNQEMLGSDLGQHRFRNQDQHIKYISHASG
jgi:hypothetical protein